MLSCLITGATGLLGRHLVDVLVEAGMTVRAYVRPDSDTRRLARQGVELVCGDAFDDLALRGAVAGADLLFHAAGYLTVGAPFTGADGAEIDDAERALYQAVNVDFTEALLAAAIQAGVQRFIYISSSSVYAPDAPVPTLEDAPLRPVSVYGQSKLAAEEAVRAAQATGLETTIVRPPVAYGPGDRYFTPFALRLARLPVLPLVNGGKALLDLVYARDVAELMWQAARHPQAVGRVYNAGPGRPTSLASLVSAYRQVTGTGPLIVPVSAELAGRAARLTRLFVTPFLPEAGAVLTPQGMALVTRDLQLSMARAKEELAYVPRFDLVSGLKETVGLCLLK